MIPDGADIEIIERTDTPDVGYVLPNEVRINGKPVLTPNEPIIVHEMSTSPNELVRVTLTLYARRVTIGTEPKAVTE